MKLIVTFHILVIFFETDGPIDTKDFAEMMFVRPSTKNPHFVMIPQNT